MENERIAHELFAFAEELDRQDASLYRRQAYRRAAESILALDEPVAEIALKQGRRGLGKLPAIGEHIARAIERLMKTGSLQRHRLGQSPI